MAGPPHPLPRDPHSSPGPSLNPPTSAGRPTVPTVHLRAITPADLPELFRQQSDPEANRMAIVHARTPESFEAHWSRVLANPAVFARAILADASLVGHISCFPMEGLDCVGYWIDRDFWGRGIATRALTLLLDEVPTRPLHAFAASSNIASIRVLERCGFIITGSRQAPADERFPACEETMLRLG